ncbi:SDR family NAD(P)-dependent oxidoreductase [uncultured Cohaesibacter sp.]|uniref:SDR family NAD(P)-dependent oxidoreductase n=1 Tax=uncultured Cohaesibacter sp. TaxID=1002546 RepID=UPI0029C61E90|nr:SDR family NAD(P)-dependent oxidoreductase [uncultured Cohaesibacter sp.]
MSARTILITGASRGLGAALARAYAQPDVHLILTARTLTALEGVSGDCGAKGAVVSPLVLDLVRPESIEQMLEALASLDLPDLVISNAGVFSGRHETGELEDVAEQAFQLDVNLGGTIRLVDPLIRRMQARRSGHVVLISSLAALQPQPDSPAYSASKAGIATWGLAIRDDLADHNVRISVVYPGHVESDQTAVHVGALPGIISADKAAAIICKGIARNRDRIIFPQHLRFLIGISNLLPGWLRRWSNRPFRYRVRREGTSSHSGDGGEPS